MKFFPRLLAAGLTLSAAAAPVFTFSFAPGAMPTVRAAETEATFDVFYNNLADQGDWYNTPDYGYVWQPYIAYKNDQWRPYTDGYWAETDQGWTWVSYEDFGWACYHYGRWTQLESTGWVWVPGYEWGPGWVSWRTGDEYVGWAPLPPKHDQRVAYIEKVDSSTSEEPAPPPPPRPEPRQRVLEGRVVDYGDVEENYDVGYNSSVDVAYDIGPSHYCFVPVGNFGAPYIREFIVPPAQNVVIIERTSNVTNIVYRQGSRGPRDRVVYAGGPDYNFIAQRTERPVPRLLLERRTDVAYDRAALRADQFNIIRDNRLEIAAPLIARRPFNSDQLRPARIKEIIARPQPIHGWRTAEQQDPRAVERLRTQFQQQARQAPPARVAAERFITPTAFRAQPPLPIHQQQAVGPRAGTGQGALPPGASGLNAGPNPAGTAANVPPAPIVPPQGQRPPRPGGQQPPAGPPTVVNPTAPTVVQPAPPNGRALTETERQAKRDTKLREMQDRQRGRAPAGAPAPGQPADPAAANTAPPAPPAQAPAPAAPDRKGRTPAEREANRAAKQQAHAAHGEAPTPVAAAPRPPEVAAPNPAPAQAERSREERRAAKREHQAPPAAPQPQAPAGPSAAEQQAKEQRRAARHQEQARESAEQVQQAARAREESQRQRGAEHAQAQQAEQQQTAAREERHRARAAQEQQQQQQQVQQQRAEAAGRAREAQQAQQRETRRAPAPQPQPAQPQGGGNGEEERKHKHRPDGQPQ